MEIYLCCDLIATSVLVQKVQGEVPMCRCGDISTQACLHTSTQAHLHIVVICPCGDVPVWRYAYVVF